MTKLRPTIFTCLLLAGTLAASFGQGKVTISPGARINAGARVSGGGWTITGTEPIEIRWGGEVVTAYQTSQEYPHPFFYPIIGPTGENLTRHWPIKEGFENEAQDHPHQRSLWFGLGKVNGRDFWHDPGTKGDKLHGKMIHTGMKGMQLLGAEPALVFHTTSDWVADEDHSKKVCQDKRTFRLERRDGSEFTLDAAITIEATEGDVLIEDDKEGAWALRVTPTLRMKGDVAKGDMINSTGLKGGDVWGKRANWVDFFGPDQNGARVGIAMFDHPANLRNPSWWHARDYGLFAVNPFGQGHFEKGADPHAGDHTIKAGDSLTLRYRLLFHLGDPDPKRLDAEYEDFGKD